jgi:two-component system, NarL family, sensor kinase
MLCSILLLDEDGVHARHGAAPSLPDCYVKAIDGSPIGPQAGSCGTAMYRGRPVIVADILEDPLWKDYRDLAAAAGLRACWSTPILSHQGKVLGSFAAYYGVPRDPRPEEMRLTEIATSIAGIAIMRQRAEEALRESEQRFRAIFNEAGTGISLLDLKSTGSIQHNRALQSMLGCSEGELNRLETFSELTCEEDREHDAAIHRELCEGKRQTLRQEKHFILRDGSHAWANVIFTLLPDSEGRPGYVIGMHEDITERKQAEKALRASQELLQSAIDSLSAHVAILDERSQIIAVNLSWRDYAEENGFLGARHGVGMNYLAVCEAGQGEPGGRQMAEWLRSIMRGERNAVSFIYSCAAPSKEGWFMVRVTRFKVGGMIRLVVAHENISEVKQAEEALRQLTARLLRLQDEERRRIARELHDMTAQNLLAVTLGLAEIEKRSGDFPAELKRALAQCRSLNKQSLQEIRTLSYLLHPPLLDEAGLVSALRWYSDGFSKRSGIEVDLVAARDFGRLPSEVETALFRVVQECLTNIYRHSGSETAHIRLERGEGQVRLVVRDSGRGMGVEADGEGVAEGVGLGVGILGMEQRLRQLGGRLKIKSNGGGTTIIAAVPLGGEGKGDGRPPG